MKKTDEPENELPYLRDEIVKGLLYTHTRINAGTVKTLESASFLYALIEILSEKGIITIEELDEKKKNVARRLADKFVKSGLGLLYQDSEFDKYDFENSADVDCQQRLDICKAVCCKFPFALSKQDVEEGSIRWNFGRPYLIAHNSDGYCSHLDRQTYRCTVREHRPVPCRGFDCRDNKKWQVWLDYDRKIINEKLMVETDKNNEKLYSSPEQNYLKR